MSRRRIDLSAILADEDLRRELMVSTIRATQAREDIETTEEQADRAYYVVTEADSAAFFDLDQFRGGKRGAPDRREEMFVRALAGKLDKARYDVPRRDFGTIDGSPLAFRRVGLVSHVFREELPIEPAHASVKIGHQTFKDARFVRHFWEVQGQDVGGKKKWPQFAKGGAFSRFYSDVHLVVRWDEEAHRVYADRKSNFNVLLTSSSAEFIFKPGLTWPLAGGAFSARWMPAGCIFGHKGPAVFPHDLAETPYLAGVLNSAMAEYLLKGLVSRQSMGGRWEAGVIKRLPVPMMASPACDSVGVGARAIHDAKAAWDTGNEISTHFDTPWCLRQAYGGLLLPDRLDHLAGHEASEQARIQRTYADLNNEVYRLYGIPDATRALIEETLGKRMREVLWPQMGRKTSEQKRMEHVWRLLSYVVKRVVAGDEDGIVPFMAAGGEPALIDRVRAELAALFPDQDVNQVEVDITNELKRKVKGYRRVESVREWLEDVFFDDHVSLYKKRPILWHIASSQGRGAFAFGALVQYHKLDQDRLAKLRGSYLRDAIAHFRREAGLADQEGRTEDRQEWQDKLEEAQALDQRLQWVQEGANGHPALGDCRIRTPWKSEDKLPDGWRPDLDDGVAVNILPLQTAGVLRIPKAV